MVDVSLTDAVGCLLCGVFYAVGMANFDLTHRGTPWNHPKKRIGILLGTGLALWGVWHVVANLL